MNLADLEGLVSADVGEALMKLAADCPADQAVVELGSFKGKSTCYLATGARDGNGARVWAVDAWDLDGNETGRFGFAEPSTREVFERQLRAMRLWSRVTPIRAFAVDAATSWNGPPVGLLFVDADHQARSVRADYRAWRPHLAPGAVVVFDDYGTPRNPGVEVAVRELIPELGPFRLEAGQLAVGRLR